MRTTITFEPDTAAAVERLRRERGLGVSAVVNDLVRRGLVDRDPPAPFVQVTSSANALLDLTDYAEVLELIEGPAHP